MSVCVWGGIEYLADEESLYKSGESRFAAAAASGGKCC